MYSIVCNHCNSDIPLEDQHTVRRSLAGDELVVICFCHGKWIYARFSIDTMKMDGNHTAAFETFSDAIEAKLAYNTNLSKNYCLSVKGHIHLSEIL